MYPRPVGRGGGAILLKDRGLIDRAETIQDKGTDRPQFLRGEREWYGWQQAGNSYLLNEMQAAYLWAQLEVADEIQAHRMKLWRFATEGFWSYLKTTTMTFRGKRGIDILTVFGGDKCAYFLHQTIRR